jgi:hypothetical protein
VNVLVGLQEFELPLIDFVMDCAKAFFDRFQLGRLQQLRSRQPPRVRDTPGDVVGIELEVDFER